MRFSALVSGLAAFSLGANAVVVPSDQDFAPAIPSDQDFGPIVNITGDGSSLAARQTVWDEWSCYAGGNGGGHQALRNIHAGFNRMFGNPRLTAASGQCYMTSCGGHYFAWCNDASVTATEISNARNRARDSNPGNGSNCRYRSYNELYKSYFYGTGDGSRLYARIMTRRNC
ncbi:hypothetical protein CSOJ01_14590 [Colletotrichum sojae]|uniref:Secreted protein n=1 Tax=Colletotrichum sojae TaxID=2175907 RepID=A0A8H6IQ68_9PEZI|nr:hypothetical protein CSOJ01_14590 [Colletotrichum sojae]